MDTNQLKFVSSSQDEGATFGEYRTTTKVNGVQSQYTPSIEPDNVPQMNNLNLENNSNIDILKAITEEKGEGITMGVDPNLHSKVDPLQTTSTMEEGAQFGEYRTTTKVDGKESIYTPSIDAKPPEDIDYVNNFLNEQKMKEDELSFQNMDFTNSNTEEFNNQNNQNIFDGKENDEKVDLDPEKEFGSFNEFEQAKNDEDAGAQFGEYRTTTKIDGKQSIYMPSIDAKSPGEEFKTPNQIEANNPLIDVKVTESIPLVDANLEQNILDSKQNIFEHYSAQSAPMDTIQDLKFNEQEENLDNYENQEIINKIETSPYEDINETNETLKDINSNLQVFKGVLHQSIEPDIENLEFAKVTPIPNEDELENEQPINDNNIIETNSFPTLKPEETNQIPEVTNQISELFDNEKQLIQQPISTIPTQFNTSTQPISNPIIPGETLVQPAEVPKTLPTIFRTVTAPVQFKTYSVPVPETIPLSSFNSIFKPETLPQTNVDTNTPQILPQQIPTSENILNQISQPEIIPQEIPITINAKPSPFSTTSAPIEYKATTYNQPIPSSISPQPITFATTSAPVTYTTPTFSQSTPTVVSSQPSPITIPTTPIENNTTNYTQSIPTTISTQPTTITTSTTPIEYNTTNYTQPSQTITSTETLNTPITPIEYTTPTYTQPTTTSISSQPFIENTIPTTTSPSYTTYTQPIPTITSMSSNYPTYTQSTPLSNSTPITTMSPITSPVPQYPYPSTPLIQSLQQPKYYSPTYIPRKTNAYNRSSLNNSRIYPKYLGTSPYSQRSVSVPQRYIRNPYNQNSVIPYNQNSIRLPQQTYGNMPYNQNSVNVPQSGLGYTPYSQTSIEVPKTGLGTLPYSQTSVNLSQSNLGNSQGSQKTVNTPQTGLGNVSYSQKSAKTPQLGGTLPYNQTSVNVLQPTLGTPQYNTPYNQNSIPNAGQNIGQGINPTQNLIQPINPGLGLYKPSTYNRNLGGRINQNRYNTMNNTRPSYMASTRNFNKKRRF